MATPLALTQFSCVLQAFYLQRGVHSVVNMRGVVKTLRRRERQKAHKHKQICGIVPRLGGCQKFVYVCVFLRVIPYGGEKTHKQNPLKNPGTIP